MYQQQATKNRRQNSLLYLAGLMASSRTTPTSNDIGYGVQLQATRIGFEQGVVYALRSF